MIPNIDSKNGVGNPVNDSDTASTAPTADNRSYIGPDIIILPIRSLPPLCERCGKMCGNCKHHPIEVNFKKMSLAELKSRYAEERATETKWDKQAITELSAVGNKAQKRGKTT